MCSQVRKKMGAQLVAAFPYQIFWYPLKLSYGIDTKAGLDAWLVCNVDCGEWMSIPPLPSRPRLGSVYKVLLSLWARLPMKTVIANLIILQESVHLLARYSTSQFLTGRWYFCWICCHSCNWELCSTISSFCEEASAGVSTLSSCF